MAGVVGMVGDPITIHIGVGIVLGTDHGTTLGMVGVVRIGHGILCVRCQQMPNVVLLVAG